MKSHLYHVDTYSRGWILRARDIAVAREIALNETLGAGHTVKRATSQQVNWYLRGMGWPVDHVFPLEEGT